MSPNPFKSHRAYLLQGFYCPCLPDSDVFCPIPRKPHSNGALRQYVPDNYISFEKSEPIGDDYILDPVETNSESVTDVPDVITVKATELETSSGPGFSQDFHGHALGAADESNHIASWTDLEVGNLSIVESRTSNVMDDGVLNFSQPWNDSEFQTMNSTLWQGADDWDEFGFSGFFGIGTLPGQNHRIRTQIQLPPDTSPEFRCICATQVFLLHILKYLEGRLNQPGPCISLLQKIFTNLKTTPNCEYRGSKASLTSKSKEN